MLVWNVYDDGVLDACTIEEHAISSFLEADVHKVDFDTLPIHDFYKKR